MPNLLRQSALFSVAGVTGSLTLPTVSQAEIDAGAVLVVRVVSKAISLPTDEINTPTGFTEKGTKVTVDATAAANDARLALFYKRPVVADSGASLTISRGGAAATLLAAVAELWGNCILTGDPFDTAGLSTFADTVDDDDVVPFPAFDPVADDCRVVYSVWRMNDFSSAAPASFTNDSTTFNKDYELTTTTGSDASVATYSANRTGAALGAVNVDFVQASTGTHGGHVFALLPEPPAAGGWLDQAGADLDLNAPLLDEDEATYIQSPANPNGEVAVLTGFADGVIVLNDEPVTITVDAHQASTGTDSQLTVEMREDGTLLATRLLEPLEDVADPGNRWELVLTDEERELVVLWSDVQFWVSADGGSRPIRITRFRVSTPEAPADPDPPPPPPAVTPSRRVSLRFLASLFWKYP